MDHSLTRLDDYKKNNNNNTGIGEKERHRTPKKTTYQNFKLFWRVAAEIMPVRKPVPPVYIIYSTFQFPLLFEILNIF